MFYFKLDMLSWGGMSCKVGNILFCLLVDGPTTREGVFCLRYIMLLLMNASSATASVSRQVTS